MRTRELERRMVRGRPSLLVSFGPRLFLVANISIVFETMAQVVHYLKLLVNGDPVPSALLPVESAAPLYLWAAVLTVGSALVVVGSLDPPRLRALAGGHVILFVTKMMIAVGGLVQLFAYGTPGGWRISTTILFGPAIMSLLFAIATVQRRKALLNLDVRAGVGV